jgi:Spy/CpxP family protein refolding chaperone
MELKGGFRVSLWRNRSFWSGFGLVCSVSLAVGGCSPPPSQNAGTSGTPAANAPATAKSAPPKTQAEVKQVLKTRKQALSSPKGLASKPQQLDRALNQASSLKLTADQQKRLKDIRSSAAQRLNGLMEDAKKQRAKADDLAKRGNEGKGVSLTEVRRGLVNAANARKKLEQEQSKVWKEAQQVLTPAQRSALEKSG